ncbi:Roquin-1 [Armadillidium nasatum]|uniref:Roquin-1 n=1 Tax=Armadillidium nasatum TaxID=96803 RepID=A0A5N5TL71_9CRUS|nr:Roquin-1 [Armadillidium nasatum]
MPIQAPQWTEFLSCPICCHEFDGEQRGPISLGCGHTVCRGCLAKLQRNQCPYDQTVMRLELDQLPVNGALLSLVNHTNSSSNPNSHGSEGGDDGSLPQSLPQAVPPNFAAHYYTANQCCGLNGASTSILSRPMQRKLVTLINCQLVEEEGRARAVRAARSLGERTVTELILHHQNHHQLSANLWAAVRSRGCQFLGPAMQEEVLKLVLLALEDGSALSRKVLVMFVVQRLEPHFPQASKTSIGHVVQLLYRASCFKVSKREGDSSLMQLKEEFRTYEALRREHDAQIELVIALQRTGDPGQLSSLRLPLELLASLDPSPDSDVPGWESCARVMEAVKSVVTGLVQFIQHHGNRKITEAHHAHNAKSSQKNSSQIQQQQQEQHNQMSSSQQPHSQPQQHTVAQHSNPQQQSSQINAPVHITPNPILSIQPQSLHPAEIPRPIIKNGDRPSVLPVIGKPMVVEEIIQPGIAPPPPSAINPYEPPKFVQVPSHSSALPVIPAPASASVMRQAIAPPPTPTPVYATPIPEYTFGPFPPQGTIFAQSGPPAAIPALHPSAAAAAPTPVYSPQHPASLLPDIYSPNAQTVLVNQEQMFNIISHPRDFTVGAANIPVADTRQTSVMDKSVVSSWLEVTDNQMIAENITFTSGSSENIHNMTITTNSTTSDIIASKSLTELKERKEELLNQLENIVGKEAIDEVASQIANGEVVSTTTSIFPEYSATYSIWTSGANLSNISWAAGKSPEKTWDPSKGYRTNAETVKHGPKEDFIPFDPPVVSRFGPISRMPRPYLRPPNPIQVSACNTTDPVTTPTVHRPVLYQPGFTAYVSYPPSLDFMNTIGHGIIDPPHLHMSQLDPSGTRPSDPILDFIQMGQEERQRQQFIAAKEGIEAYCLHQKFEEMRLKEELNKVMQGIQEKKREIEESTNAAQENSLQDEDMTDFEKNWKFDFDEGEKDAE